MANKRASLQSVARSWTAFLSVAIVALFAMLSSASDRVGSDSAANLLVSMSFAETGRYESASRYSFEAGMMFDPTITTGPTVLLPVTILIAFIGEPVISSRIIMWCFWAALSMAIFALARRQASFWVSLAIALIPLGLNLTGRFNYAELQGPSDLVGEIPATFFIVLAILFLRTKEKLAFFFLGFAVLTKMSMVIILPVFIAAAIAQSWGSGRLTRVKELMQGGLAFCAPLFVWEIFKFASLGLEGYLAYLGSFVTHFRGSSVHTGVGGPRGFVESAIIGAELVSMSFFPAATAAVVLVGVAMTLILGFQRGKKQEWLLRKDPLRESSIVLYSGLAILFWWITLNDANYTRTAVPGVILALVGLILVFWRVVDSAQQPTKLKLLSSIVISVLSFSSVLTASVHGNDDDIHLQRATVAAIESFGSNSFSYSQTNRLFVNDLIVLGNLRPTTTRGPYAHVVAHPPEWNFSDDEASELARDECKNVVFTTARHTVCEPLGRAEADAPIR